MTKEITSVPMNGNRNSPYNRKRDGGRTSVYMPIEQKEWFINHARSKNLSLSGLIDGLCAEYAKENGYIEPEKPQIKLEPSTPQPVNGNKLTQEDIMLMGKVISEQLTTALTNLMNGAAKCLML